MIKVEVAYATNSEQVILEVEGEVGITAEAAIQKSGILERFPEIDIANSDIGIFAKTVPADTVLRELDRVEIYRPLIADPKEVRKQRAAAGKKMKRGGGDSE